MVSSDLKIVIAAGFSQKKLLYQRDLTDVGVKMISNIMAIMGPF